MDDLLARLDYVQFRRRTVCFLTRLLAGVTVILSLTLTVALIAGYWPGQPPEMLRWGMFATAGLVLIGSIVLVLACLFSRKPPPAGTARLVEQANPKAKNDLVNAVLLAEDPDQASPTLVQLAIHESLRRSEKVDFPGSVSLRALKRWGMAAGLAAAALGTFGLLQPTMLSRGLLAAVRPLRYVPPANGVTLLSLSPGDATIFAGQELTIQAKAQDVPGKKLKAAVIVEGQAAPLPMYAGTEPSSFALNLGHRETTIRYALTIGDSRWPQDKPYYTVKVLRRAGIECLDLRYDYPAYTKLQSRTDANAAGPIEAPQGSRVTVTLRLSDPVAAATMEVQGATASPMSVAPDGKTFTGVLAVERDGGYRIVLKDDRGQLIQQLPDVADVGEASGGYSAAAPNQAEGFFSIRALEDAPPTVEFLTPNRDVEAAPGGAIPMRIRVWDKYGLTSAGLLAGREGTEPETIKSFDPAGRQVGQFEYGFKVDKPYRAGDVIVYRAVAADNRNSPGVAGPQIAWSPSFKIIVRDAANLAADKAKRQQELLARLAEILKLQERCRLDTELCLRQYAAVEAIAAGATRVRAGQARIRDGLSEVSEKFQFDTETVLLQRVVAVLARNEAPRAVEQAAALAAIAALEARGPLGAPLARTQDQIIRSLQALLAILPSLSTRSGEQQTNSANAPPDVPEKLRELKDKLEVFIVAERKVIQASRDLVGKPVDDFSPQDRGLLRELTAVQDKWEQFLEEGLGDFSKLPQQDFSTDVMLEELASVKSDVTMAKSALEAQAVTVATAFEDNGVENAKTLTSNIEKWLPEEPDRKKWEMEDPAAGGTNIEQAELPSKLEDLVGDLLEEEEDIFQEMQDLTAKYATSLDLGAGWDAMDGPISNMNAQGVTGNQLPNDSELAGRSGEGRQGKSNGEYVEDQAVGKGGRRTPTRLTPEPYQEGQVKDLSLEPPGGATGGGKVSGAGMEGIEGPVPPPLAEEMGRLAGRQAVIVGKARRLGGAFQPGDYAGFRLQEAVTLMSRVANDLGSFRYRNVLRARPVALGAIQRTATLLGTGIDVSDDGSEGMPKNVRENVTDAMKGNLPADFRDALEHYYRRLSEQAGKSR